MEKVEFYAADNTYRLYPGEDDEVLEQVRAVHKAIVADQNYVRDYEDNWRYTVASDDTGTMTSTYIRFIYTLHNGLKVERRYSIPMTKYRMSQDGTYDNLLDALVNSQPMKARRLHAGDDRYTVESGSLWLGLSGDGYDLNSREAAAILDAVARDAASGAWGDYDWFDRNNNGAYAIGLELRFGYPEDGYQSYDWIEINVRPGMDHTVACLKELGLVTDRDLVTREAMEKMYDRDNSDATEYAEKMAQENVSVGIIGGADGPTTVVVTGVTA